MIRTLVEIGTFYGVLLFLYGVSTIWSVNEGVKRGGAIQDRAQIWATFYELLAENNPAMHCYRAMYCITFCYYCIPMTLYQHIVKHNEQATLVDPTARLGK